MSLCFYKGFMSSLFLVIFFIVPCHAQSGSVDQNSTSYQAAKIKANQSIVTIMTSGPAGTYMKFAHDMALVLNADAEDEQGLRILPVVGLDGEGSLEDVLFVRGIDMGVVQTNAIAELKKSNPSMYKDVEKSVRYITQLYNAEWHVVAPTNIKTLADLEGKTVNLFEKGSATDTVGRMIFDILGIKVNYVYMKTAEAIKKIKSGEIAATTLLTGAPNSNFVNIKEADNLHLVPIREVNATNNSDVYEKLMESYLPAKFTNEYYPGLVKNGTVVPTLANSILLAVYNWPEGTERYKKLDVFVQKLFSNIDKFKNSTYHPKWKDINLAARIPGWTRFKPATLALEKMSESPSQKEGSLQNRNDGANFQKFLDIRSGKKIKVSQLTDEERVHLYEQFLEWMKNKR